MGALELKYDVTVQRVASRHLAVVRERRLWPQLCGVLIHVSIVAIRPCTPGKAIYGLISQ